MHAHTVTCALVAQSVEHNFNRFHILLSTLPQHSLSHSKLQCLEINIKWSQYCIVMAINLLLILVVQLIALLNVIISSNLSLCTFTLLSTGRTQQYLFLVAVEFF